MKIKNSISQLKTAPIFYLCLAVTPLMVFVRCYQMFLHIEPETGFTVFGHGLMTAFYVILFVCCLAFNVVAYLSKSTATHQPEGIFNKVTGAFTAVFGIALISDFIESLFKCINSLGTIPYSSGFKDYMASGFLTGSLQSLLAFLSALYFIILAFDFFKGTAKATRFKILALAPVGWASVRLVHRFIRQISFLEVSDLFLELVMICFEVLFFMALAQVISGVNSEGFTWRLSAFGLSGALIAAALNGARLIVQTVMGAAFLNENHPFSLVDLAFAAFVLSLVYAFVRKPEKAE